MANNNIQIKNALFINAGAGSGKTYRLTNDLADFLSGTDKNGHNPGNAQINPSEIIATTFTKVAAAEIKERARQELLIKGNVKDAAQLDTSAIGTIHSVAQQFLNKYWYLLNSCPNQEVITDEDKKIYRNQSLGQLFNGGAFAAEREAIQKYFDEFQPTKNNEKHIPVPDPEFWVEHVERIVGKATYYGITNFANSIKKSCDEIDRVFNNSIAISQSVYDIIYDAIEGALKLRTTNDAKKFLKQMHKLPKVHTYHGFAVIYGCLDEAKKLKDVDLSKEEATLASCLISTQYGNILKEGVKAVFAIAKAWIAKYENFKRSLGVIDYDDMEKGFNSLLDIPEVQGEIHSTYKLVMVDEFQDCNPMQLKIFAKLSEIIAGNSSLPYSSIWVGDPNQSIYGFRGSDTDLINRVKALFTGEYPNKNIDGLSLDSLDTSYRSCDELVDYANGLFMSPFFKEYTELKHNPNAVDRDENNAAVMQWNFQKSDQYDKNYLHSFAMHLKDVVENRKYQVQQKGTKKEDRDALRDIDYKDIAILAKTNKDIEGIVKVLREEGVPASAPESNILDRAEVQLVLAILNLRGKDKNGDTVERPHELATLLRLWNDKTTEEVLGERVEVVKNNKDWSAKHSADIDPIRVALNHTKNMPIDEKLTTIILELDLYDKVAKWGEAEVRRQNLMTLQSVAKQFVARCSRLGIAPTEKEFTLYLKDAEINPEKDNTSNSVRVFTYHGSKGLEWPMVILYSLDDDDLNLDEEKGGKPLNKFFVREYFGVHEVLISDDSKDSGEDDNGLERDYFIHYFPTPTSTAIAPLRSTIVTSSVYTNAKNRRIEESKRLFYVGVTRARDYLAYFTKPYYSGTNPECKVEWDKDFCWPQTMGLKDDDINPRKIEDIGPLVPVKPECMKIPKRKPKEELKEEFEQRKAEAIKYNDEVYPKLKEEYDAAKIAEEKHREALKTSKPYSIHDLPALADNSSEAKYLHPSQLGKGSFEVQEQYEFKQLDGAKRIDIHEKDADGKELNYRKDAFGSCIHNIFAACPYDGKRNLTAAEMDAYYEVARTIIGNYHLRHVITDVEALVGNLMAMFTWLKGKYGEPTAIVHEYPFNYSYGNGSQVVRGEIDLVYCTETVDVIIDFKNFMGEKEWLESKVEDHEHHFVGTHYVAQLSMYKDIWKKANNGKATVTYLYYDILGGVVEV